ncbi:MAG TPA: 50S ribosomal protein L35 [Fibrobacteres bacterium]|jgi:large subunit ribosomal protein L35|nr:50S ribosomal protein L35 [Fibrobacterota bacterium]
MPKMKTHSGAKKRFRVTASGKLKYRGANLNHINAKKKPERKNRIGGAHYVDPSMEANIKRLLRI